MLADGLRVFGAEKRTGCAYGGFYGQAAVDVDGEGGVAYEGFREAEVGGEA